MTPSVRALANSWQAVQRCSHIQAGSEKLYRARSLNIVPTQCRAISSFLIRPFGLSFVPLLIPEAVVENGKNLIRAATSLGVA